MTTKRILVLVDGGGPDDGEALSYFSTITVYQPVFPIPSTVFGA
jgi:hypothetical protein